MKNYLLVNRALAAEKNINFFNNLFSRVKEHSSPTVTRRSPDGQSRHQATIHPLSFVHRTLSRCTLRYVAMVAMMICLGVGEMWGGRV